MAVYLNNRFSFCESFKKPKAYCVKKKKVGAPNVKVDGTHKTLSF